MRRIMEESPVKGYKLFRFEKTKADGTTTILPNYYIRYRNQDICTGTDRLKGAKAAIKKQAGQDAATLAATSSGLLFRYTKRVGCAAHATPSH